VRFDAVTRVLLAGLMTALLTAVSVQAANADPVACPPGQTPTNIPGTGAICVPATDPGGGGDPGDGEPGGGGQPTGCHDELGNEIDCTITEGGYDQVWFGPPKNC